MLCHEFRACLYAWMDGELGVSEMLAADAHATECRACAALAASARQMRELVRRQPREVAPAELRGKVIARVRRDALVRVARPWAVAAAAALLVAVAGATLLPGSWLGRAPSEVSAMSVVDGLVDTHSAYAQLDRPAEFVASRPTDVEAWFLQQTGLRVPVPDLTPAGIRLLGGRLAAVAERRAAYVIYTKGHTLLSVFMVPLPSGRQGEVSGSRVSYEGHEYLTQARKGYRTVLWTESAGDRSVMFGLVSMLDWDALLECAARLRAERESLARV